MPLTWCWLAAQEEPVPGGSVTRRVVRLNRLGDILGSVSKARCPEDKERFPIHFGWGSTFSIYLGSLSLSIYIDGLG